MRITIGAALLILSLTATVISQQTQQLGQSDRAAAARVKALSDRLQFRDDDDADKARYYAEFDSIRDRIRSEVDDFVRIGIDPDATTQRTEERLRAVLADHKPNPDYGDLPFARIADLRGGRSLLLAYTIVRPPHHDAATIRGYAFRDGRFELSTSADSDFVGYDLFTHEVTSPIPGEVWFLAWGQAEAFNGTLIRFRLYSFDGGALRIIWGPNDMFNASLRFVANGFVIDHEVRSPQGPNQVHDEYTLTPGGPVKSN